MNDKQRITGGTFGDILLILCILFLASAIFFPILANRTPHERRAWCHSKLKDLGTTISLYCGDYNDTFPSSALYNGNESWDPNDFNQFASKRGVIPPPDKVTSRTWLMLLYPYMKDKDIIWCPSDPNRRDTPDSTVSYYWKAAVDYAWYNGLRRESDFVFPADQIILYEHTGWHYGDVNNGLVDSVCINCLYVDGHVVNKRIINSGYTAAENPPGPLPKSGVGEPAWFNYDFKSYNPNSSEIGSTGKHWDARVWGDNLP